MEIYIRILEVLLLVIVLFMNYIKNKVQKSQTKTMFIIVLTILLWICLWLVLQYWLNALFDIPLIYFEYFMYIGTVFLPVAIFFVAYTFVNTKITFNKKYLLLFIIPIISLIVLWTNDFHHLFYVTYSVNYNETKPGPYVNYVHNLYTYLLIGISLIYLIKYSIKNSGFFSKQSYLFCIGTLIPIIVNILGVYNIIPMSIHLTPISFTIAIFFYAFAIFRFKFLSVTPIALQKIVDRMSDCFIVIDENNNIISFNETFLTTFNFEANSIRNMSITDLIQQFNDSTIDIDSLMLTLNQVKTSKDTFRFEKHFSSIDKYFNIEINSILSKKSYLGTLILLKDITQHILDMQTIKDNQSMLMEKERLASLGQLVGGIAHNLKTPIMSISGASEGLSDLVREYDSSIGDPEVTEQDHHDIAHDMNEWIEKIKTHTAYMSDIITAVKGQAVTLSENEQDTFTIDELIKRVNILMKHELKNALIDMDVHLNIDNSTILSGNVNSLVQVINNMISNAIQSYNGKTNEKIDFIIDKNNNNVVISVRDYGTGMSEDVKNKLFKEMITTKGKNGTGLGMFMSYSTIRGNFNGNITFDSEVGKGTTFNVILPLTQNA